MGFADKFNKNKPTAPSSNNDANSPNNGDNTDSAISGGGFANKFSGKNVKPEGAGFADSMSKKNSPQSYTDKVTRRSDLVYLVHGKDRGRDAWHYVLVEKNKLSMFLKQIETGSIDVALYGEVLRSGWGANPPPEIVKEIEEEFG